LQRKIGSSLADDVITLVQAASCSEQQLALPAPACEIIGVRDGVQATEETNCQVLLND
jgi:hypothetical protein